MSPVTFHSMFQELASIEKNAGLKDLLKAIAKTPKATASKAKQLTAKLVSHPQGQKLVGYASNPNNIADLSHSLANIVGTLT